MEWANLLSKIWEMYKSIIACAFLMILFLIAVFGGDMHIKINFHSIINLYKSLT